MKKLIAYGVLFTIFILNSGAGCSDKTTDPKPDTFPGLIGKWKLTKTGYYITKSDGTKVNDTFDTEPRGINIVYEFFDDGRLVVTDVARSTKVEIRWSLKVIKSDDKGILEGQLIQIGNEQKELAKEIGQSGDLTFQINTTPDLIFLVVDVTKMSTYPEMTLIQNFKKM
ncbi:hypothetical protein [Runella sp.]|uniref:hypothetical protein n=1 Tax=Runella sp. TaxID=1960881 RepID=UPI003D0A5C15